MAVTPITAIVPTLGSSPHLLAALRSLRREGGNDLELIIVHQGSEDLPCGSEDLVDRICHSEQRLGFAAANNLGFRVSHGQSILLLNDDAELQPGWLSTCCEFLETDRRIAGVQGINLYPGGSRRVEGAGIEWSRRGWQALQRHHSQEWSLQLSEKPSESRQPQEVFGVSAAACLLRRKAIESVLLDGGHLFDEELDTYYEDVELAGRLQKGGWQSYVLPRAVATHVGGASAQQLGSQRLSLLYSNRYLTVARLLGQEFPDQLFGMVLRDLRDMLRRPTQVLGILKGWKRARRLWSHFANTGEAMVPLETLLTFRSEAS